MTTLPLTYKGDQVLTDDGRGVTVKKDHLFRYSNCCPVIEVNVFEPINGAFKFDFNQYRPWIVCIDPSTEIYVPYFGLRSTIEREFPCSQKFFRADTRRCNLTLEEALNGIPLSLLDQTSDAHWVLNEKDCLEVKNGNIWYGDRVVYSAGLAHDNFVVEELYISRVVASMPTILCFDPKEAQ
jgi:hypothetical protein